MANDWRYEFDQNPSARKYLFLKIRLHNDKTCTWIINIHLNVSPSISPTGGESGGGGGGGGGDGDSWGGGGDGGGGGERGGRGGGGGEEEDNELLTSFIDISVGDDNRRIRGWGTGADGCGGGVSGVGECEVGSESPSSGDGSGRSMSASSGCKRTESVNEWWVL